VIDGVPGGAEGDVAGSSRRASAQATSAGPSDSLGVGPLELTRLAAEHLATKGVPDPRLDAELLLAYVLGIRRLDLYLQFERPVAPAEVAAYRDAIRRRGRREPLQYITGRAAFRELVLAVDPRVLIPRPETEVLVGEVLAWSAAPPCDVGPAGLVALDIGTGSGAIGLSLLHEAEFARVVATDISEGALTVAAENAERLGLADRLELRLGSVWAPIGDDARFHVIVANPPYVTSSERDGLMPEVRDHEPADALFAGPDGLDVVREIVDGAPARLTGGGLLALEVGLGQAAAVVAMMEAVGLTGAKVVADLTGRDRLVLAQRARDADQNAE
jgi:release factor glutamine methyltransferase